jgi:hypothetical protein
MGRALLCRHFPEGGLCRCHDLAAPSPGEIETAEATIFNESLGLQAAMLTRPAPESMRANSPLHPTPQPPLVTDHSSTFAPSIPVLLVSSASSMCAPPFNSHLARQISLFPCIAKNQAGTGATRKEYHSEFICIRTRILSPNGRKRIPRTTRCWLLWHGPGTLLPLLNSAGAIPGACCIRSIE